MYFCPTCNEDKSAKEVVLKVGIEARLVWVGDKVEREYPKCCRVCQNVVTKKAPK